MQKRRSVRRFSSKPVSRTVIEECIRTAGTAPSGTNRQPWFFAAVQDQAVKDDLCRQAELEEERFYESNGVISWEKDLELFHVNARKPFLQEASWLIVIFAQTFQINENDAAIKNYYVMESVGLAAGMLITAVHKTGLAALPYTPSRQTFLRTMFKRPINERPFLVLAVGYPAQDAMIPDLSKKTLSEIASFH